MFWVIYFESLLRNYNGTEERSGCYIRRKSVSLETLCRMHSKMPLSNCISLSKLTVTEHFPPRMIILYTNNVHVSLSCSFTNCKLRNKSNTVARFIGFLLDLFHNFNFFYLIFSFHFLLSFKVEKLQR